MCTGVVSADRRALCGLRVLILFVDLIVAMSRTLPLDRVAAIKEQPARSPRNSQAPRS